MKKKLVVFTGSGISRESGLDTFRDKGGWWDRYSIEEVATPSGWKKDREKVLGFYNQYRKIIHEALPNAAHKALVELEQYYDVTIITQNVDNLHERAGSTNVIHLHGEIMKSRSTLDHNLVYEMDGLEINLGDKCAKGSQLRPHLVWFNEMPYHLELAAEKIMEADVFIVIGTSLQVTPASDLVNLVDYKAERYLVDPSEVASCSDYIHIKEPASIGVPKLVNQITGL